MVDEFILAESVEEEDIPPRVVGWKVIEEDENHWLDVEDDNGLCMKDGYRYVGLCIDVSAQDIIIIWRRRIQLAQRELGARGVLSGMGSLGNETIDLSHQAISLSDEGRAGIDSGFGSRCDDMVNFDTTGIGVVRWCELGNISHEGKSSGRRGLERTNQKRRREERQCIWREMVALGLRKRISGPTNGTTLIPW
jgi:hypothetical protein